MERVFFQASGWRAPFAAAVACAIAGIGFAGCANLPGATTLSTVETVAERGPYFDVGISSHGSTKRFFFPANETCRSLLRVEAVVDYVSLGPLGQFQSGGATCEPIGIGSLAAWRDQRPRPEVGPLPARQANYRLEYQDNDLAMLRGRFPLLGLIGWPGMGDTLVLLPKSQPCQALIERSVATIEYRVAGLDPYVLLDDDQRCPVLGLIQPIGER